MKYVRLGGVNLPNNDYMNANCIFCSFQNLDLDQIRHKMEDKDPNLIDIQSELSHRFKDFRMPFQAPSAKEIFDPVHRRDGSQFLCWAIDNGNDKQMNHNLETISQTGL